MSNASGDILSCTCRELKLKSDTSVIGLRHELGLYTRTDEAHGADKDNDGNDHDYRPMADAPVDQVTIAS